ncbi:hypothetical protein QBC46DRAFT_407770 [Diplogelasinospora grovesii]|uniref:Uncharacterized protein n=1 Tax=Diplogelasinospora grovesii TaxID=303347 RepID=A0AAN6NBR4_9PEZI|nr:hypothetical protein QBC46DRAFT_407770 [Diplogelasinospora grovesii]
MLANKVLALLLLPLSAVSAMDITLLSPNRDPLACLNTRPNVCCFTTAGFLFFDDAVFTDVLQGDKLIIYTKSGSKNGCDALKDKQVVLEQNEAEVKLTGSIKGNLCGAIVERTVLDDPSVSEGTHGVEEGQFEL